MKTIKELKAIVAAAHAAYTKLTVGPYADEDGHAANQALKQARKDLNDAILVGANACPSCGSSKHLMGLEQPAEHGAEFEVGCKACAWFMHDDGTARDHAGRGRMPQHAVESWNAGPDYWKTQQRHLMGEEKWKSLKPLHVKVAAEAPK